MKKINEVITRNDFADYIHVKRSTLTFLLYKANPYELYKNFSIKKKNGDDRIINAPNVKLKRVQRKLAKILYNHKKNAMKENNMTNKISHGFEKRKSFITNAVIHRNKKYVLNIDLENFFDCFHFGRVRGFFIKNRYFSLSQNIATIIAQLSCFNGKLPQGAPTSPIISNLIFEIVDFRLLQIAKKYKMNYTRYADDLTFSTNDKNFIVKYKKILDDISKEIEESGFRINNKKTRIQNNSMRQNVTGLVVNKKLNVNNDYCMQTRAMANYLYKNGEYIIDGETMNSLDQLEGRFAFINQLDWYNNKKNNAVKKGDNLNKREKQYQLFLLYKYFYSNEKPLIITEGKTDIKYIKAALKNQWENYPELIDKDSDGNYMFKVRFLGRTKRMRHFLGIGIDGADGLSKIFDLYFITKFNDSKGFYEYFNKLSGVYANGPVIIIYDNESTNKKPLHKAINKVSGLMKENKDMIESNMKKSDMSKIQHNLYFLTCPLVKDKQECEIEDLFKDDMLEMKIDGKTFSRCEKLDKSKHFGKERFSAYVFANYSNIDFSGFIPLLDNLNKIVINYKKEI